LRTPKASIAFIHDSCVAAASVGLALYLRLGDAAFAINWQSLAVMIGTFVAIAVPTFLLFGMYRGIWRYASVDDLVNITKAVTLAILIFFPIMFLFNRLEEVPRSVPVIQWCLLIVLLGGARFTYRLLRDRSPARRTRRRDRQPIPVLLLGAGDAAEQFIRSTRSDPAELYRVVGVLDEATAVQGRSIHGVPVLGRLDDLPVVIALLAKRGLGPQRVIMADPTTLDRADKQRLLEQADSLGLSVACLPRLTEFKDPTADHGPELRPIALEDLLGRPQLALNRTAVSELVAGRRVLITGAGGTIGSELARQIAALRPAKLMLIESSEFNLYSIDIELRERHPDLASESILCNIRDRERVMQIFASHCPELIFHAAALKHVPLVELNPCEGLLTNVVGTRNIADAAASCGALAMVQVSTDKAVKPTSVMGASKRLAEFYCQSLDLADADVAADGSRSARFMTVRFGNVLGSSGSVVPLFQRQLARGGPLTVTHPEIQRYFMTVREAVELVLQASAHGVEHPEARGQIFVLDMGKPARIADVARQMIRLAGLRPDVDIKVQFTGLRPGEKLYEELFDDNEDRVPAAVDGVFVARSRPIDLEVLRRVFDELAAVIRRQDVDDVERLISLVLPSYRRDAPAPAAPGPAAIAAGAVDAGPPLWNGGTNPDYQTGLCGPS
jgi:FlaA1/EpsC-like NDP-sugar epimerase